MLQVVQKFPRPDRKRLDKQSFFLASPGDLCEEREGLLLRLRNDLQRQGYDAYAYEYDRSLIFQGGATYQDQIPFPSDTLARVTICLFGEKLGSHPSPTWPAGRLLSEYAGSYR
jgi:hypothetical protein